MITYVDCTLKEVITAYRDLLSNYPFFFYILGISLILGMMIILTIPSKRAFTLTLVTTLISVISIFYYRGFDMFNQITSIFNKHFYQNIFFYYWNVIIGLILIHITVHETRRDKTFKIFMIIFYILTLTNFIYSLYITNIVNNNMLLVVGNIAPLIVVGNIILLIMYMYLILLKISTPKQKQRKTHAFLTK